MLRQIKSITTTNNNIATINNINFNINTTPKQTTTTMSTNQQQSPPNPLQTNLAAAGLSRVLTEPTSPTSPHSAADAARAMSTTGAWQPRLDRRQSWDAQEYKHELQKSTTTKAAGAAAEGGDGGQRGFTERG